MTEVLFNTLKCLSHRRDNNNSVSKSRSFVAFRVHSLKPNEVILQTPADFRMIVMLLINRWVSLYVAVTVTLKLRGVS
jgi:hypothetical protein